MVDFSGGGPGSSGSLDGLDTAALQRELARASAATASFGQLTKTTMRDIIVQHRSAAASGRDFARTLSTSFRSAITQGKSLSDTLRDLALRISDIALKAALKPVENAIGGIFGNLAQGIFGSARGNVLANGRIQPFARGGVVNSPMLFPLRNGAGLAGEAGPEAILPLRRGPDGRLGVAAGEGGGRPISVTFNVTATDANSFRRSETQITAMLARAASRGQRNL